MIRIISYDTVLCASRHDITNSRGEAIEQSVFPEVCKLNVKYLDSIATKFLLQYKKLTADCAPEETITLNVYVTGFTPALVALINMRKEVCPNLCVVFWHYDNNTKSYISQVLL